LSVVGKGSANNRVCSWEVDIWYEIISSDGAHCPLRDRCTFKPASGWCIDECLGKVIELYDSKHPDIRDFDCLKGGQCSGIFGITEMLADRYRGLAGVQALPASTQFIQVAGNNHAIDIVSIPLRSLHGALWRLKDRWIIYLNSKDTPAMRRFTLFHEVFHMLTYCNIRPSFRKKVPARGPLNECLADSFASYCLMPPHKLKEKWQEIHDVDRMTQIFDVPKASMFLALRRLCLI